MTLVYNNEEFMPQQFGEKTIRKKTVHINKKWKENEPGYMYFI